MTQQSDLCVPDGTYFFTLHLQDRHSRLLVEKVDLLRDAVRLGLRRFPFRIDAAVVLPDHLHMIWTLPAHNLDASCRWRLIKSAFSRHIDPPTVPVTLKLRQGEKGVWQRGFEQHRVRNAADFEARHRFLLEAPVRAGLCARPQDWRWSSIHRPAQTGRYLPRWQGAEMVS